MIDILDKNYEPTLNEMTDYTEGKAKGRWLDIIKYINNYNPKNQFYYSRCSAKPGWNIKYKKKSKAICTLYPSKDYFTILIVLNEEDMNLFENHRNNFTNYVINRYNDSGMMNGTKWIMIDITDNDILNDVKEIIKLKIEK